jgi:hypothetical protein
MERKSLKSTMGLTAEETKLAKRMNNTPSSGRDGSYKTYRKNKFKAMLTKMLEN